MIVWVAYLYHSFLVIWAALLQLWRLPVGLLRALITGIVVALAGVILLAMGIFTFRSIERMSGQKTDELIDSGVYAWSRNPQNVGWGLALMGIAVAGRSGYGLLLVVLFALVIHVYTVKLEEPFLEEVYGEAYRRYRSRTNRYLGFPG
ncbi:MAG: methyltransferase [Anaerolineales bacterium]